MLAMDSSSAMMLGQFVAWYAGPGYGGTSLNSGRVGGFACAMGCCGIEVLTGCHITVGSGFVLVLQILFFGRFMWPFAVAGLGFRYFVTNSLLRSGHPLRKPFFIAFMRLEIFFGCTGTDGRT